MKPITDRQARRYPELRRFASREEAADVLKSWVVRQLKQPRLWVVQTLFGIAQTAAIFIAFWIYSRWNLVLRAVFAGICGIIVLSAGISFQVWFQRRRCHQFLRRELVLRGVPICIKCGYDTRGQTEPRCPECGTSFDAALIDTDR